MLQKNKMVTAHKAARKAIESTYDGICSVIEYQKIKDENTKITNHIEVTVFSDVPCKLSFETLPPAEQTDTASTISQAVKLFLSPDVNIKSGSKLIVTQHGKTSVYSSSGEPAVYATHQEINLKLFKGWA